MDLSNLEQQNQRSVSNFPLRNAQWDSSWETALQGMGSGCLRRAAPVADVSRIRPLSHTIDGIPRLASFPIVGREKRRVRVRLAARYGTARTLLK